VEVEDLVELRLGDLGTEDTLEHRQVVQRLEVHVAVDAPDVLQ
jgi:hypothetical protein